MKKIFIGVLLILLPLGLMAQSVKLGIYQEKLVRSVTAYCSAGSYQLILDGKLSLKLAKGDVIYMTLEDGRVKVLDAMQDYGHVNHVELLSLSTESVLRIRPVQPEMESRLYDDNLLVIPHDRFLTLVNEVDLDKYLAGVVEAEAGGRAAKEFYKAQSVLCRTYALKQMDRHSSEGFSLCDEVHCQAFKGKSTHNPEILEAIVETGPVVAADYNFKLITASYHANSGGQTQRASDVWLKDLDYLQSVVDPYSLHQSQAKWRDTISFKDWKAYLLKNGMEAVKRIPEEIIYVEQMRRKKYYILEGDSLRLTKIREDWGFKSTFFDMFPDGDSILVWGKGYGHGIGMSQEGAMKMALDGYNYEDILHFYFHEIRLLDYRDLPRSSLPAAIIRP